MKLFTMLIAAAAVTTVCAAENLVKNGDFAQGGKSWGSPQYTGGKKFHTFDGGKLIVSGNKKAQYNSFASLVQELPLLDPTKEYLLQAEVDANVPEKGKKHMAISVRHADESGKSLLYTDANFNLTKTGMQQLAVKFRPHASGAKFYVYVRSSNFADTDTVTVDNIRLTEIAVDPNAADNMVQNGNFESKSMLPWYSHVGKAKTAPFAILKDPATANYYLAVKGDPQNRYKGFLTLIQKLPPLASGKKYQLKARIKAGLSETAKKEVCIKIREIDMDNVTVAYTGITVNLAQSGWQEYTVNFIPRVEADTFEFYIFSRNLADGDTICVDDISLIPVK